MSTKKTGDLYETASRVEREIRERLARLAHEAERLEEAAISDVDWSAVGSLQHINNTLAELLGERG